ncbi:unnamed protein product [Owenia fusiformis]|uniref:Uncharacterized protein n=1 Tax=Owenia fusiformis TaxID=6347 RepID=A0A8J1TWR5_OWEFU|nr:unnamed protein product [Owenia fusiformis]
MNLIHCKPILICGFLTIWLLELSQGKSDGGAKSDGNDMQCPSCEKIHCTPRRPSKLRCKGGITRGICNCCPVCAKVEGETCGGEWNYLGKCDRGLQCEPRKSHRQKDYRTTQETTSRKWKPEGICQQASNQLSDQGLPAYCLPQCSPVYCRKNPKAVCAAIDIAERKQNCQGDCQHTSCSACRFVNDEPDCIKCRRDDFQCMKNYGKCVRKQVCTRHKFPCKKKSKKEELGKFVCKVPECLD